MFFFLGGLPLLIIGLALIALLAGKAEPDPDHERPRYLYLAAASYVAVLVLFSASFFIVDGLLGFSDDDPSAFSLSTSTEFEFDESGEIDVSSNHDDDVASTVGGVIAGALALGVLWFHLPKLRLVPPAGPGGRIYGRYLYLVCFAAVFTGVAAAGMAAYQLLALLAPDTLGNGDRADALRSLASGLGIAVVAGFLFLRHWAFADDLQAARRGLTAHEEPPSSAE